MLWTAYLIFWQSWRSFPSIREDFLLEFRCTNWNGRTKFLEANSAALRAKSKFHSRQRIPARWFPLEAAQNTSKTDQKLLIWWKKLRDNFVFRFVVVYLLSLPAERRRIIRSNCWKRRNESCFRVVSHLINRNQSQWSRKSKKFALTESCKKNRIRSQCTFSTENLWSSKLANRKQTIIGDQTETNQTIRNKRIK